MDNRRQSASNLFDQADQNTSGTAGGAGSLPDAGVSFTAG
jgi:hypothetical protein